MSLPLSHDQTLRAAHWMKSSFSRQMQAATHGTPFNENLLIAIACQETAYVWLHWIDRLTPDIILAACVFDASGDVPNTNRYAFPRNRAAFTEVYGEELTQMLVQEANCSRALRDMQPSTLLYKGYGIFQYDLQHIKTDEAFFRNKLWYSFQECLNRVMIELRNKYLQAEDLWLAVQHYNGRGIAAQNYRNNVKQFYLWLQ